MIQLPPTMLFSKAMQYLKGGTSRELRKDFPEIQEFLWGDSFWADGYFAETVGVRDYATIKQYIQDNTDNMLPHK